MLWPELLRTLGFGNFGTELGRDGSVTNTKHKTEYVSCCILTFTDGDHFEKWSSVLVRVILVHFRVKFYKTVGNTNVLSEVGNIDSMCGDALKLLFKYRGKVYLKASQGEIFI